jgi:FkbM family methyltransferase
MADPDSLAGPVEDKEHAKSPPNSLRHAPGPRPPGQGQLVTSAGRIALTASAVVLVAKATRLIEPELIGLRDLVKPGSVCIDVGSAAGLYTVVLSHLAGPTGEVHSVEPVSFAHSNWTRLLGSRSAENVKHHATALGAEAGRGVMSVPVGRHGPVTGRSFLDWKSQGLGSNAEFAGQMEVAVDVQTLDGLCEDAGISRLDFVKIDVEGAEMHILEGGQRSIEAFQPAMLVEIEARHSARYQYSPDEIAGWLLGRGYSMHTWHHGWQQTPKVSTKARNYLFLPRDWSATGDHRPVSRPAARPEAEADQAPASSA